MTIFCGAETLTCVIIKEVFASQSLMNCAVKRQVHTLGSKSKPTGERHKFPMKQHTLLESNAQAHHLHRV